MNDKSSLYDPKSQGERLKLLRMALRLSRRKFSKMHGIPVGNLQNWEEGRYRGITQEGVSRMIDAFAKEGITCSKEWILYGTGQPPELPGSSILPGLAPELSEPLNETQIKQKELSLFQQLVTNAIDTIISDDSMSPVYLKGDHVAGRRRFENDIQKLIDRDCIVQTEQGLTLVRQLQKGETPGHYNLVARNPKVKPVKDSTLFSAAPVIWMRRLDPFEKL